jgi:hypothetical protein
MASRNKWEPREPLAGNSWSLLRNIGMSRSTAYTVQLLWASIVVVAYLLHPSADYSYIGVWLVSAWMLNYITQRLRGVPAVFRGPSYKITEDEPFQIRLALDIFSIGIFIFNVAYVLLGPETLRGLLK